MTIVREHNILRNRIASGGERETFKIPPASNMLEMVWDDELADIAMNHALQCSFEHDCSSCREVDNFQVGQNLYQRRTSWLNPVANWTKAIHAFYDEISYTPSNILSKFKNGLYGHFTQMVWAKTWRIGCGYSAYAINDTQFKIEELYVCNYGPAGNVRNQRVYAKGKGATRCPINTSPSKNQSSLCAPNDLRGSLDADPELIRISNKTLFYCDFSNDSLCGLEVEHQNNSHLVTGLNGNYLSFVLSAGQKIKVQFPSNFSGEEGFCVQVLERKGANLDGQPRNNSLIMRLQLPEVNWLTNVSFGKDSLQWVKASMDVNWSFKTNVSIIFSVPEGATRQFFEMKSIRIKDGKCSKSKE